ncbi:MAG: putative alpha/beta hydrolase [Alphaproteobacteria bacterium]|jgi:predicted alpha/beta hydrolase
MQMKNRTITTADNTTIAISEYKVTNAKASIIISGAAGVARRFYKHFALWTPIFDCFELELDLIENNNN